MTLYVINPIGHGRVSSYMIYTDLKDAQEFIIGEGWGDTKWEILEVEVTACHRLTPGTWNREERGSVKQRPD